MRCNITVEAMPIVEVVDISHDDRNKTRILFIAMLQETVHISLLTVYYSIFVTHLNKMSRMSVHMKLRICRFYRTLVNPTIFTFTLKMVP